MQKITPSEALVETLRMHDVKYVFGIVGSAYMDALDIFEGAGIQFIPVAHEQGAAHMADGYARISHKHGVCIAQNGPGITNFVTAIAAAYWAHSPKIVNFYFSHQSQNSVIAIYLDCFCILGPNNQNHTVAKKFQSNYFWWWCRYVRRSSRN